MRIVVTGGAGFIGSCVVDQLAEAGHDVVVLDNLDPAAHSTTPDYLRDDVEYRRLDVRDPDTWLGALPGADTIVHLAGKVGLGVDFGDAVDYVTNNDVGAAVGLGAAHELGWRGRYVLGSSMVVYGEGRYRCVTHGEIRPGRRLAATMGTGDYEPPCPRCGSPLLAVAITEDVACEPRNVYAATKLHQEHLAFAFGAEKDLPVTALRFHNVYGPRMPKDTPYAGVASIFLSALAGGGVPRVLEDGGQTRDFVHVVDVARAVCAAATDDALSGAFNVASGEPRTVLDLAAALTDTVDASRRPEIAGGWRDGDVRHVFASPERLWSAFDCRPIVAFDDGVAELATAPLRGSS